MVRAHKTLAGIYLDKEEIPRSSWHQNTALQLALQAGDMELEGRIRSNLGNLAMHEDDLALALNLHYRDLEFASTKFFNFSAAQERAHQNLAIVFKKLRQMNHAHHHENLPKAYGKSSFLADIKHHIHDAIGNIHAQISNSSSCPYFWCSTSFGSVGPHC
uniref:AlNc14C268G9914 protein n=1 Tax=Albugo laibachii Nc14 TaxID=890382 RepID=F0WU93_9STRA|nr:AlNc14C268G9914 [Albugo laibachii Nc14]|eukprot:CCA24971.1 AlNc14C268G9914 [Albugo laibachii Nc14]